MTNFGMGNGNNSVKANSKLAWRTSVLLAVVIGAVCMAPTVATAEVIQIQVGGVDFGYDGTNITDMDVSDPDTLTNATFLVDNALVGVDVTGVTLDLLLPDVSNIPVGGGQVTSAADGTIDLDLGGGEFLSLTLEEATIAYLPLVGTIQFVFAAADGSVDDQNLPYGISMVDPVSISFSTQILGTVSHDGTHLTAFRSSGTGEFTGVPEPATMTLLALGGLTALARRRRRHAA